jgi:hypothetical protein
MAEAPEACDCDRAGAFEAKTKIAINKKRINRGTEIIWVSGSNQNPLSILRETGSSRN